MTRFVDRHEQQAFERSIKDLTASSELKRQSGRLDQALVDLDTALNLCQQSSRCTSDLVAELRKKREELAIREAQTVLDRLLTHDTRPFPIGDWLTLKSRAASDPDLVSLRGQVEERFQAKLKQRIERDLDAAKAALASGQPEAAFESCDATAPLLARLDPAEQKSLRSQADQLVSQLVDRHGIYLDPPRGHFLKGSESKYHASMMPGLFKAAKAKGYVPQVSSPLWRDHWSHAAYRLTLQVDERLEGNYMASENRLTRIDASLTLYRRGKQIWTDNAHGAHDGSLAQASRLPLHSGGAEPLAHGRIRGPALRQRARSDRRKIRLRPQQHARLSTGNRFFDALNRTARRLTPRYLRPVSV